MPKNIRANIELGANIVVAIAIVVVAVVVVKRYAFPPPNPGSLPAITKGERLSVPNVDWNQNKKTLVFFLMKDCKYCETSTPLYRQLIEDASKQNVQVLAILPNPVEAGRKYVEFLQLQIENVQAGSLGSYKIPGTPSVLLVDNQGTVKSAWIGAVPGRERQMRDELVALFDANP